MRKTTLRISGSALENNAREIRRLIPQNVRMLCVVKADAYGHGAVYAANAMLRAGADAFAVAIVEEAVELRNAGIDRPVVILGGACEESIREAVRVYAGQAVYSTQDLDIMEDEARKCGVQAIAHLKIDSGMSRVGVRTAEQLETILDHWKTYCPNVRMEGIFTHFCVAESDPVFTEYQRSVFVRAVAKVKAEGFHPIAHAAATSAMLKDGYAFDMVRAGIGLYGTLVPELDGKLRYAQTLSSRPIRIQTIQTGETVGYGRTFTAQRETRIMTVPIGYGDGYPRILSNRADILVCGKRAPIAGNVCMDMIMADITDIPEAGMDSEIVLMGAQGNERITPDELARHAQTIPYEIMLGFSARIHREYEPIIKADT